MTHPIVLAHPENGTPWPSDHADWTLHFENETSLESFIKERADDLGLKRHRPFYLLEDVGEA